MGTAANATHREPWNMGKIVGQKAPFKLRASGHFGFACRSRTAYTSWRSSTGASIAGFAAAISWPSRSATSATATKSPRGLS
jgi:hypothetical protein